jgi:hypothetical protein
MVIPTKSYTKDECLYNNQCNKYRRICEYYNLIFKNKNDLQELQLLVDQYEANAKNNELVTRRRTLWNYMKELQNDDYTRKFIFFDIYADDQISLH